MDKKCWIGRHDSALLPESCVQMVYKYKYWIFSKISSDMTLYCRWYVSSKHVWLLGLHCYDDVRTSFIRHRYLTADATMTRSVVVLTDSYAKFTLFCHSFDSRNITRGGGVHCINLFLSFFFSFSLVSIILCSCMHGLWACYWIKWMNEWITR